MSTYHRTASTGSSRHWGHRGNYTLSTQYGTTSSVTRPTYHTTHVSGGVHSRSRAGDVAIYDSGPAAYEYGNRYISSRTGIVGDLYAEHAYISRPLEEVRTSESVAYQPVQTITQTRPVSHTVVTEVEKPPKETVEKVVEVPVEKIVEVPVPKIEISTVYKVVEVPKERIVQVPVEKIIEIPVDKVVQVPVEKVVQVPVDRLVNVPVERIVEVPVQVLEERVVEKIVEVPVELPIVEKVEDCGHCHGKGHHITREVDPNGVRQPSDKQAQVVSETVIGGGSYTVDTHGGYHAISSPHGGRALVSAPGSYISSGAVVSPRTTYSPVRTVTRISP